MRKLLLLLLVVLVAACGGKKDKPAATDTPHDGAAAKPSAGKDGGGAVVAGKDGGAAVAAGKDGGAAVVAKKEPLIERKQVEALMTAWLEAQNSGDFAAYAALYTDDFKGVRRSGKQTVRLDQKGWLGERKKMFARPMIVAARDVEIVLGNGRATAKFMQEWSSGKYHDVGPKVIEVSADGSVLKIAREELLVSKIVKTAKPRNLGETFPIYPLWEGVVVIGADVVNAANLDSTSPKLLEGSVPERDPACDDDPPDYEDQDRYWACESSDPDRGHATFVATASVDPADLPKDVAAWIGQQVRIGGGDGPGCTATVDRIELYADVETTYAAVTTRGDDDASVAEVVLEQGATVVARLTGGCKGEWAQLASSPAPVEWAFEDAPADVTKAVLAKLKSDGLDEYDLDDIDVEVIASPDGKTKFAYASRDEDECSGIFGVTALFPVDGKKVGDALLDDPDLVLRAAVDTDGDGWPELVFIDGIAKYDADTESYDHIPLITFVDEIATKCNE
jgi:ketosteroid isomerase-like protein